MSVLGRLQEPFWGREDSPKVVFFKGHFGDVQFTRLPLYRGFDPHPLGLVGVG